MKFLGLAIVSAMAMGATAFSPSSLHLRSPFVSSQQQICRLRRSHVGICSLRAGFSDVTMPALSSTMKEGKIVQWTKSVGDRVDAGDIVMVVESDKADMDVEAFESGFLAKILVPEGSKAAVGSAVAILAGSKEEIASVGNAAPAVAASAPAAAAAPAAAPAAPAELPAGVAQIAMPALSSTMKEGKIVQWTKAVGDRVEAGDIVMVVESDKADMDVEAFESGYLAKILVPQGASGAVGAAVALLVQDKADIDKVANVAVGAAPAAAPASAPASAAAPAAAPAAAVAKAAPVAAPAPQPRSGGRVVASPLAKVIAAERGIDLSSVSGTGPNGRIVASDVQSAQAGSSGAPAASGWKAPAGTIMATPQARKAAKANGIKLEGVKATGPFGRITEHDVLVAAGKAAPAAPASTKSAAKASRVAPQLPDGPVKLTGMQVAVARNMDASLNVPVFRVSRKIRTDKFDELYAAMKPKGVTVSALLTKAVALVLEKHPLLNAHYDAKAQAIVYHANINIANAVAIEGGLITPVIKNANVLDVMSLNNDWKELVSKAKAGKLKPDEFQSGTFTISNLGMFGVSQFGAILPPGTGSILAVGGAAPVVQVKDGIPVEVKQMEVTITSDHRHIYGADAAQFLKDLADLLENNVLDIVLS